MWPLHMMMEMRRGGGICLIDGLITLEERLWSSESFVSDANQRQDWCLAGNPTVWSLTWWAICAAWLPPGWHHIDDLFTHRYQPSCQAYWPFSQIRSNPRSNECKTVPSPTRSRHCKCWQAAWWLDKSSWHQVQLHLKQVYNFGLLDANSR